MKRTKQGKSGGRKTPKIQITSSQTTGMPQNPKEGDEFHDTLTNVWFMYKNGEWTYIELP